jgi:DNA-binding MarR family transcriptional regulator
LVADGAITPGELVLVVVLIDLAERRTTKEVLVQDLAARCGRSAAQTRQRLASLEQKGLIERQYATTRNAGSRISLEGLCEVLAGAPPS